ncbi:MAG: tetratricopeptide repeat protein [Planctomycetes bacterium]|nr:tetratricopeptide repeat protein [Planctomycetota bacterium]
MAEIGIIIERGDWSYVHASDRVALGRYYLLRGADAREVLEHFYDRAKKDMPGYVEAYLAAGELALEKHDYALAAEAFRAGIERVPGDPAGHLGLALAYEKSEPDLAAESLSRALELNPRHAPSLLRAAERCIEAERYDEAREVLDRILAVNPRHPLAFAYKAALAHLASDAEGEAAWRYAALSTWPADPAVDHAIGRILSRKYRFAAGAAYQRRALALDPSFLPARFSLAQDLLRLGEAEEGWRLAGEVFEADNYNVVAHNLVTLRDTVRGLRILRGDGISILMDPREADIFGPAALALLSRAKRVLCAKYDVAIDHSVAVEIFREQKDFAVRTFGLPGGEAFLGVCFGNVITAASPAVRAERPANWQAVLWHEFCHAVTLHKTMNRMPRWLSEGISVYEEKQENPAWGQSMNARYRRMVIDGELTPVSRLSGAFLQPPSPAHLEFAYYEASLVVEYLVETRGIEAIREILADLGRGAAIDEALARHAGPPSDLDGAFAVYARARAEALAPEADWQPPDLPAETDLEALAAWSREHPRNIPGLRLLAEARVRARQWEEAKAPLRELLRLYPEDTDADSAYLLLASVHRELGETDAEREVLEAFAARANRSADACRRLLELAEAAGDWEGVARNAERLLALNPLLRAPHRALARAAEALGTPERAIPSYRALLSMDPADPAEAHHRLARLFLGQGEFDEARRHVLQALEEAPRFRAAYRTLLEVEERIAKSRAPEEDRP